jgi:hypothetical protein
MFGFQAMVTMHIPKLKADRTIQLVRVSVSAGVVVCKDDAIRRKVEQLKPLHGPPGDDPEPDWTLARECKLWLAARIVKQTRSGNGQDPGQGVVQ